MTALQEIEKLRAELAQAKAVAAALPEKESALATVTAERDTLATANAGLIAERDALAAKLATAEKANKDFAAAVETKAAAVAVQQLAAVGAEPAKASPAPAAVNIVAALQAEKDPAKRAKLFKENRAAIRAEFNRTHLA
jgi:DNA repair exonuclease SbcCD ATPase subunit